MKLVDDSRNAPLYTQSEASRYLNISKSTLRYWAIGEQTSKRTAKPLIQTPDSSPRLSFLNLVELHVLNSFRTVDRIDLPKIRVALEFVQKKLDVARPLLDARFETDGVDLFIQHLNTLVNVSKYGQQGMPAILASSLKRIKRDSHKIPLKLFPYTHTDWEKSPSLISMTPNIFSGRPVIEGTGISTAIIAERYKAGDSVSVLSADYGQQIEAIEEAIRCELLLAA